MIGVEMLRRSWKRQESSRASMVCGFIKDADPKKVHVHNNRWVNETCQENGSAKSTGQIKETQK